MRILCVGLEGQSRESAHALVFPNFHCFDGAKWVDTLRAAKIELDHKKCPFDLLFVASKPPDTFFVPAVDAGPLNYPGLTVGEGIVVKALKENPSVRCIVHYANPVDVAKKANLELFLDGSDNAQVRTHFGKTIDWRDVLMRSGLFPGFVDRLELTAST